MAPPPDHQQTRRPRLRVPGGQGRPRLLDAVVMHRAAARLFGWATLLLTLIVGPLSGPGPSAREGDDWSWPVAPPFAVARDYVAPAHAYGPGHRGIDLAVGGETSVRAPDDGVVAFAGRVVDRGVVTIDHGDGIVSTLEPVDATVLAGERVSRGQVVGMLSLGGHSTPGTVHLGARVDGEYLNPLVLLGAMPRAVLLPYSGG